MTIDQINDIDRLKRINAALMSRVESAMDQQRNAFSLFQTAINLEGQVRRRTDELTSTMRTLEKSNLELARQRRISEDANQSKTRFLAAASHDVLQPLHAAQLTISALMDVQATERGKSLVHQVERSLDTMYELLSTLLDISRLDAGVMIPDFQSVSVRQVVEMLMSDFRPLAAAKGLKLKVFVRDEYVRSDRAMLRRALQNLISNAIRYTQKGGIIIGTRRMGEEIAIEVFDTGPGIPADQRERIFDEFQRGGAKSEDGGQTGLGLGLAIVRRLVDTLGHGMSLTSVEGQGSRFRITARPAAHAPRQVEQARQDSSLSVSDRALSGRRILLIENDPAVTQAMRNLMENWGCEYRLAACGKDSTAALDDGEWRPELVIADQQLDQGDLGTQVVMNIRAKLGGDIPVIITTAETGETIANECQAIGAEYMAKPIKPAQLRALIWHLLAEKSLAE